MQLKRYVIKVCVVGVLVGGSVADGQSAETKSPNFTFDVTSVKSAKKGLVTGQIGTRIGIDDVTFRNVTLKFMICYAYATKDYQVIGGPAWISGNRYDIYAKATSAISADQVKIMLQALLADRFHLMVHADSKDMLAYALTSAKGGVRFHETKKAGSSITVQGKTDGTRELIGEKSSMKAFAAYLSTLLDRPVVDQTGLTGEFDFSLRWDANSDTNSGPTIRVATPNAYPNAEPNGPSVIGPSIITALNEQLGLKVVQKVLPVAALILDDATLPAAD